MSARLVSLVLQGRNLYCEYNEDINMPNQGVIKQRQRRIPSVAKCCQGSFSRHSSLLIGHHIFPRAKHPLHCPSFCAPHTYPSSSPDARLPEPHRSWRQQCCQNSSMVNTNCISRFTTCDVYTDCVARFLVNVVLAVYVKCNTLLSIYIGFLPRVSDTGLAVKDLAPVP
ncbi:hypothetical protein BDZ45DRAFT_503368 [Acephala macrosclerotiorum]|nr:hypothetical protein BDZ45DRAFT_503368 [Acephala macrosclerotiorum]